MADDVLMLAKRSTNKNVPDRDVDHSINQRIFETSVDLILVVDRRGVFVRVSPSSQPILGYPPEEMTGRNAEEFLHPEDLDATREQMRAARRTGQNQKFESRYIDKQRRSVTLAWTGVWSESDGQYFFIGRDMTERKKSDDRLRETNDTLQAVIDASPFAIVGVAPSREVLIWNQAAEAIFGYAAAEALGRPYDSLAVPLERQADFEDFFGRACLGERLRNARASRKRKDGTLFEMLFGSAPVYAANGELRAIVYAIEDVTKRNAMEEQLRQSQKMEAVGQLTGGLSHDLNNLLAIIIGNLDLLQQHVIADVAAIELLNEALQAAQQGADLNQRLLAFARRQPLRAKRIDVNLVIQEMAKLLRRTLGEHIDIAIIPAADLWPAIADPTQLEAALTNLAVNARDAMPNGGRLTIGTRNIILDQDYAEAEGDLQPGEYVTLEVSDTGAGMTPEVLARVFEPFFTTKEKDKGTGLGLSMVFGFAKQSGGHIKLYSEVGVGSTVRLYLPRTAAVSGADDARVAESLPHGDETILIVEDNEKLRRVLLKQLHELGYRVLEAPDARAAVAILEQDCSIDLLFTDIVMPGGMNGWELARMAVEIRPGLNTLFTSGFPDTAFSPTIPNGVVLLGKPYRKSDLAQKLRQALSKNCRSAQDQEHVAAK